jgi:fucose 4-O-acetylase-like acetyltransferase
MTTPDTTHSPATQPTERLHALDALRAVAMMLGVWLHAALPFVAGVPFFFWPFLEPTKSAPIAHSVTIIHSWRMETFFLLSGFFTAMLVARRGGMATLRQRAARVLVPFVIAMVTIQPLCAFVWAWGISTQWGWPLGSTAEAILKNSWGVDTPGSPGQFGRLYHLWFLYDLCLLIGAGLLVRFLASLLPGTLRGPLTHGWGLLSRAVGWCVGAWLGVVLLALPVVAALTMHGPSGAQPNGSLTPQWQGLAYYALPFFAGWALYAHRHAIDRLARRWWVPALIAALATVVHVRSNGVLATIVEGQEGRAAAAWWFAVGSRALMTAGYSLAMIGLFTRLFSRPGPRLQAVVRYVSDSAYWVYLAHLPLVIAVGLVLLSWEAHPLIKFGACVAVSMVVLMISYAVLVRHTPLGRLLNGRRPRRVKETAPVVAGAAEVA